LSIALLAASVPARATTSAEERVLDYVRTHLQPGQPLMVTDLYNRVFTQPDERQALNKLYNAFFRIPLFVANYQEKYKKPPTLTVIAQQFDLHSAADADVLLRVMESDPRVPQFLIRDPKTGEITHVDVERIKSDPKFGQALARQIGGWEGLPAPDASLTRLGGGNLNIADFRGKIVLLEVWFTGCPPCMQEAPALVSLDRQFRARGLIVIGANADEVLGLDYDDSIRQRYVQQHQVTYPIALWSREADQAYGGISIFPTIFLIDRKGVVRGHWIGYVTPETLQPSVTIALAESSRLQVGTDAR
jgi:thiol-disulfide isomerase/thioredoxin